MRYRPVVFVKAYLINSSMYVKLEEFEGLIKSVFLSNRTALALHCTMCATGLRSVKMAPMNGPVRKSQSEFFFGGSLKVLRKWVWQFSG